MSEARDVLAKALAEFYVGSHHVQRADAILARLAQAGYKVLGREPTMEMSYAGNNESDSDEDIVWRAMWDAASEPT